MPCPVEIDLSLSARHCMVWAASVSGQPTTSKALMHGVACSQLSSLCGGRCCSRSQRPGRRSRCPQRRPRRPCCPSKAIGTAWTCARPGRCPFRRMRACTAAAAPASEHRCGDLLLPVPILMSNGGQHFRIGINHTPLNCTSCAYGCITCTALQG